MNLSTTIRSLIRRVRSLLRDFWVYALYTSGALASAKSRIRAAEGAVVLTLHRVLPDQESKSTCSLPGMVMAERTFASMVRYLAAEHRVFPLDTPRKSSRGDQRIAIAITFDDGWVDNARNAQAILARHAMPAAIFLCSERMDQRLPFWPEKLVALFRAATRLRREEQFLDAMRQFAHIPADKSMVQPDELVELVKQFPPRRRNLLFEQLEQMGFGHELNSLTGTDSTMSWEDARELSKSGFLLGSHTCRHEILTRISLEEAEEEIAESRGRLDQEIGGHCVAFAYPNGDWSPEVCEFVASAGYAMAFANKPGIWTAQTDPFTIPRIGLWEGAVTDVRGRFSKPHFEYVVFWKTLRESKKTNSLGLSFTKKGPYVAATETRLAGQKEEKPAFVQRSHSERSPSRPAAGWRTKLMEIRFALQDFRA